MFRRSKDPVKDFDKNAQAVAKQFALDHQDVKKAYADKPESLATYFNTMSDAKKGVSRSVIATAGVGLATGALSVVTFGLATPLMAFTAWPLYRIYTNASNLKKVENAIEGEVGKLKALPPAPTPPALPPAPPQLP